MEASKQGPTGASLQPPPQQIDEEIAQVDANIAQCDMEIEQLRAEKLQRVLDLEAIREQLTCSNEILLQLQEQNPDFDPADPQAEEDEARLQKILEVQLAFSQGEAQYWGESMDNAETSKDFASRRPLENTEDPSQAQSCHLHVQNTHIS